MRHLRLLFFILKTYLPLTLAHHPLCEPYKHEMVQLRDVRLCKGCVSTYPPFLLALPLVWLLVTLTNLSPSGVPIWFLFLWTTLGVGLFLMKGSLPTKIRYISRVLLFFLTGGIFMWLLLAGEWFLLLIGYFLANILGLVVFYKRYQDFERICSTCPERPYRGEHCSGFRPYIAPMEELLAKESRDNSPRDDLTVVEELPVGP